jgi:hypothetical protein
MPPGLIVEHQAAVIALADAPLSFTGAADLLATASGRDLLQYIVTCALPTGTSLVARDGDSDLIFPGDIGLAPSWVSRPLDFFQRRLISACLLARANQLGIVVTISILGPDSRLDSTPQEDVAFPVEEGAFYGDVFSTDPRTFVCRGTGPNDAGGMTYRRCAVADPSRSGFTLCGYTFIGSCEDVCAAREGNFYSGCRGSDGREVDPAITIHVTP